MAFADLVDVLSWSIDPADIVDESVTSDTSGMSGVTIGNTDWSASVTFRMTEAGPGLAAEGLTLATVGKIRTWQFVENTNGEHWKGLGSTSEVSIDIDMSDGGPVPVTITILGEGPLTNIAGTPASAPISSATGNVQWEAVA